MADPLVCVSGKNKKVESGKPKKKYLYNI